MELKTKREKEIYKEGWYDAMEFFQEKLNIEKIEKLKEERELLKAIHHNG